MEEPTHDDITQLLHSWSEGNHDALERLTPLVYRALHRLAVHYMVAEKPGHTLQPTGLVNEAFLRLIDWKGVHWQSRAHFFSVSAQLMRRILIDYARSRLYAKRGGSVRPISLDEAPALSDDRLIALLEVDVALTRLAAIDPQKALVVELRHFGGMSVEETAEALNVSTITVIRNWTFAKAWLLRELAGIEREP